MEKKRNPKLVVDVNVPYTVELVDDKPFWSGENEYGKSYAFNVLVGGEPFTFFANEDAYEKIHVFSKGSQVNLLWKEVKQDGKKPYRVWEIRQALFDDNGHKAEAQVKPDILGDKEARESIMKDLENLMYVCLKAAQKVVEEYNASNPDGLPNEFLSKDDIRTIGISLFIELRKRF